MENIRNLFVEKKDGFNIESENLYKDLKSNLRIEELEKIRILDYYQIANISENEYEKSVNTIFSQPNIDLVYEDKFPINENEIYFRVEYLPGQYDQRADLAVQSLEILTGRNGHKVGSSKVIILQGKIGAKGLKNVKDYYVNNVECREVPLDLETIDMELGTPGKIEIVNGFINKNKEEMEKLIGEIGFAMDIEDLLFCQEYFKDIEKRDPTITELKVIDTYWSDHCRHTTFNTSIEKIDIEDGFYKSIFERALSKYLNTRKEVYEDRNKSMSLMDIGTIMQKDLLKKGLLEDLEVSEEINASSIEINVDVDGKIERWLLMFKNETHNHPTEIEPFGGAATCLGGSIRDPLSGRSYVYQAMRITGSGDPRQKIEDTLEGKLPQRRITTDAMKGYSSYGNQIGLPAGYVKEIYDDGYIAKRMEVGAVLGASPRENVIRKRPENGDLVLLIGGKTGRDGLGGAVGSSREHDEESLYTCGSEVQKGNPPEERKIQRLFRNAKVSKMIKRCNDFGAGGVSVAIGELADGLHIDLDKVPTKYEGLDGTELALSESQERMAVVIDRKDLDEFKKYTEEENLELTVVASVTETDRLVLEWRGDTIVDISRKFLDTNGTEKKTEVFVEQPKENNYLKTIPKNIEENLDDIKTAWVLNMKDLNRASQKGLVEKFDNTVGNGTVHMPFGGKYGHTPVEGMVAKIPVLGGETNTCSMMSYGFDPKLSKWSPFHGGLYAVIESVARIVAIGGDYKKTRLTFQEYFERLGEDEKRWGKPFNAILGAFVAQKELNIPSVGGKDSMSGTFNDLDVPPTLISFAVNVGKADKVISPEFKKVDSKVVLIPLDINEEGIPNFKQMDENYTGIYELIEEGKIFSASTVKIGGIGRSISEMCFGNKIGFNFNENIDERELFTPKYGSILLEIDGQENLDSLFKGIDFKLLGATHTGNYIGISQEKVDLDELITEWEEPLEDIFPTRVETEESSKDINYAKGPKLYSKGGNGKPKVFIPIFPGTTGEWDTKRAFEKAGGEVETFVFKNLNKEDIKYSIDEMANIINRSQIVSITGGEKFVSTAFRNPYIKEAIMNLLNNRDGLVLGISSGFQALMKLGLLPYGEIKDIDENAPALTLNNIGSHVSTIVDTKVVSNLSPWFENTEVGEVYTLPISHEEGRFAANKDELKRLIENGQIATQYVGINPNGSVLNVEGITSPDGRILGKMGHSERIGKNIYRNIPGKKDQRIFESGINYFS